MVMEAKGKTPNIDLATALKNAAISAENAGNNEAALQVYKEWIAIAPEASAYRSYAILLKNSSKTEEAKKVVDEALIKYPNDANLLVEKINFFLEGAQYAEALTFVNNLLQVEPNNDGALFIKGLAYDKLGKEDSVIYYYEKAAAANPKNVKPLNNLGAIYVNKANAMVDAMNKLGNSTDDTKKYEEYKKQRRELYLKAKPYLERAKIIAPEDEQISRILKQIELYTKD
ncbi:MAG: tetratricopeptide repeat protein [Bacteroidetes bacterium]|nr:tetratricopeptide repeat protein [Bacteroidota bacterium]